MTDANLVAGRIPASVGFEALGELDPDAAEVALEKLGLGTAEEAAEGVLEVVDALMERAVRTGVGRAGGRPDGPGPGGLRRRRAAARLWAGRPPGAGRRGHPAPGRRAVRRRHPGRTGPARPGADLADAGRSRRAWPGRWPSWAGRPWPRWSPMPAAGSRTWSWSWPSTPGTRARATSCGSTPLADFPERHRRHNGYDRPGHPVEVVALRASARRPSPTRSRPSSRPASARR